MVDICPRCKQKPEPYNYTWPGKDHEEICQECWEQECDDAWWDYLEHLEKAGLVTKEDR